MGISGLRQVAGVALLGLALGVGACDKAVEETAAPPAAPVSDPVAEEEIVANPSESSSLPAPAVAGVIRDVTAADAGKVIDLKVGETFSISLSGVPTAGYVWAPKTLPAFVEKTDEAGGPTTKAQLEPGFAGGNHWEVTVFKATATGEGELVMAQRRPWEDSAEPDADTFKVTVKVQ